MADLRATFRKPFAEQIAALRIRLANQVPTQAWDDLFHAQQDQAFVVAGAQQADLLADLAEAVRKSVEDGTTFETFKKDFRAIVEKRGWHGWTGEGSLRGEEWRMRTIYQTNLRTSYMAGRYAQLRAGNFRYWIYKHSGAAHPRLDHLSWDGLALSPDDPFWATHYPPNGWGCGCKVRGANSPRSVARLGGDLGKQKPDGWNGRDPGTGAPPGIDKLWDYAPGASVGNAVSAASRKLSTLPAPIGSPLAQAWPQSVSRGLADNFAQFVDEVLASKPQGKSFVLGAIKPVWLEQLAARGVRPLAADISIRDRDILHALRDAKSKPVEVPWLKDLPMHLQRPDQVFYDPMKSGEEYLVLVFDMPPDFRKVVLRLNFRIKKQDGSFNIVRTMTKIDNRDLKSSQGRGWIKLEK